MPNQLINWWKNSLYVIILCLLSASVDTFFFIKSKKTFCDGRSYLRHYCVLISNVIPAFHSPSRNKEMNGKWSSVSIRNVRRNALINQLYDSSVWGMQCKMGTNGFVHDLYVGYSRGDTFTEIVFTYSHDNMQQHAVMISAFTKHFSFSSVVLI